MKHCTGADSCGKFLPLDKFGKLKKTGNPTARCKICNSAFNSKQYHAARALADLRSENKEEDKYRTVLLEPLRVAWI